jgi:hypothetical protein
MCVPAELWVSTGRDEGANGQALRELTHDVPHLRVIEAAWRPWPAFRRLVAQMDLLLQPSFSETFNNVCADGIAEGVATVVGPAIDWAPAHWRADPDDACDVARVAQRLLHDDRTAEDGRAALAAHLARGVTHWRRFLAPAAS